jgi:hypothetical protein
LLAFLFEVKGQSENARPPNSTMMGFLADVLQVPVSQPGPLFARMGDVLDLPRQISESVLAEPRVSDTYLQFIPEVSRYLDNLVGTLTNQGPQVPPDTLLAAMDLCSEQLSLYASDGVRNYEDLITVRDEIKRLIDDVIESDVEDELTQFIVDHLYELLDAIDRYRISGVAPIRTAVSKLVGDLQIRIVSEIAVEGSVESRSFGDRMWKVVSRLADLVNITAGSAAITTVTMQALSTGHPH